MRLGNTSNYCYSNSVLKALLYAAGCCGYLDGIFGSEHHAFLTAIIRRAQSHVVHLWQHPLWRTVTRGWHQPAKQHDAAEFLQHLNASSLLFSDGIDCIWQAREAHASSYRIVDAGQSAPLLLPSPGSADRDHGCNVSVGSLLQGWHRQSEMHAMLTPTPIVILQANRFGFAAGTRGATKRKYRIVLDPHLDFPCFLNGLECYSTRYQLCSVATHLGNAPTNGHYQVLFFQHDLQSYLLADDGRPATMISADTVDSLARDTYLFVYIKC